MKKDMVKQLIRLKEEYGVSYTFICEKIGVSVATLHRYIKEENRNLNDDALGKLAVLIKKYNRIKL